MDRILKRMLPGRPWEVAALAQARRGALELVERSMRAAEGDAQAALLAVSTDHLRALVALAANPDALPCMSCHGTGCGCDPETGPYTCENCDGMGLLDPEPDERIPEEEKDMGLPHIMKPDTGLLEEAGDRWMRSLGVTIECGADRIETDALRFEELAMALGIRHLAVHPRTREIVARSMPGERLSALVERNWSAIDSFGICDLARDVQKLCAGGDVAWRRS